LLKYLQNCHLLAVYTGNRI